MTFVTRPGPSRRARAACSRSAMRVSFADAARSSARARSARARAACSAARSPSSVSFDDVRNSSRARSARSRAACSVASSPSRISTAASASESGVGGWPLRSAAFSCTRRATSSSVVARSAVSSAASVPPATNANWRFSWSISSLYGRLAGGVRVRGLRAAGVVAMVAFVACAAPTALRLDTSPRGTRDEKNCGECGARCACCVLRALVRCNGRGMGHVEQFCFVA